MSPARTAIAAGLVLAAAGAAHAQNEERYQLERTEDGYVRLDTTTGQMSLCREEQGELVCRFASEQKAAGGKGGEILDRLERIEDRLTRLEAADAETGLPSEDEFERSLSYMERFMRRFMGLVQEFQDDEQPARQPPAADRT